MKKNIDKPLSLLQNSLHKINRFTKGKAKSMKTISKVSPKEMNILIFKHDEWWIAQCLEFDIAAQARSMGGVQYELQRIIMGRIITAKELGIEPFANIPPAPESYRRVFKNTNRTFNIEFKPIEDMPIKIPAPYSFPKQAALCA